MSGWRGAARGAGFALLLVAVAVNLRAFLTSSSPLLEPIRAATGLGLPGVALLTVLPMLCMGPMSLVGVSVGRRLGARDGVALGLWLIALACASRVLDAAAPLLLASAALAGLGVGLVQALMPGVIKAACGARTGVAMGLYSAAIMGGGALAALGSPWVARWHGQWRHGLAVWAVPALGALALWWLAAPGAARREGHAARDGGATAPSPWRCLRSPRAWLLAWVFGLINGGYTSLVAWLPSHWAERGASAQEGGAMLALMTGAQVVAALGVPALAAGRRDLRPALLAMLAMQLAGFAGLLRPALLPAFLPASAPVLLLGAGLGGAFALCMGLALDHRRDPAQAGALAAFMQGPGFMIAAFAPFLTGWLRSHGGGFEGVWLYLGAVVLALVPLVLRFDPRHHARATAPLFGPEPPPANAPAGTSFPAAREPAPAALHWRTRNSP